MNHANRLAGLCAAVLVGLIAGCEESPVGTEAYAPEPCTPPATSVAPRALEGVDRTAVRAAVLDAAERMTTALPAGGTADELRAALGTLAGRLDGPSADTGCRLVDLARTALEAQADAPATLPDRAALEMVLELATAALAGPDA